MLFGDSSNKFSKNLDLKPHNQNYIREEEEEVQPEEKLPAYQKDVWLAPIVPFLQSEHFLNATMVCVCILQHRYVLVLVCMNN